MIKVIQGLLDARSAVFDAEHELSVFSQRYTDCDKNHPSLVSARGNLARARNVLAERIRLHNLEKKIQNGYNGVFADVLRAFVKGNAG